MSDRKENTGTDNSGNRNSGDCNSGDWNSGYWNSGYWNSGNRNSGDWNSGNCNSGDWNSGNRNSGNRNSGDWNSGDWNSGYCNSDTPMIRLFNKQTEITFDSELAQKIIITLSRLSKPLCEWISEANMNDVEKEKYPTYKTTGGYLKINAPLQANTLTKEDEEFLRALPNFDAEILLKCTGIDLTMGKTVKIVVDGKEIQVKKEVYDDILRQFSK